MDWDADSIAERYDVIKGDLHTFRSSGGNFAVSLSYSLEDDGGYTQISDPLDPASPNEGFYYVVRAQALCKDGTYNSERSGLVEDRDL